MRSRARYHAAHIIDSVSFPIDLCGEDFFVEWDAERIAREIIKNKEKLHLFKMRKRLFITVIAGATEDIAKILDVMPLIFNDKKMRGFAEGCPHYQGRKTAIEDVSFVIVSCYRCCR